MQERKETGVHGTLLISQDDWKFNSKQLLYKTFNSRMNIIETRAVLEPSRVQSNQSNLVCWFNSKQLLSKTLNSRMNIIETRAVLESSRAV